MNNFDIANKIANFASELDWDKSTLPEEDKKSVSNIVETLYDIAEICAGDRASELYSSAQLIEQRP